MARAKDLSAGLAVSVGDYGGTVVKVEGGKALVRYRAISVGPDTEKWAPLNRVIVQREER